VVHRNLKYRSRMKPWKVIKMGEKCLRYKRPKAIHILKTVAWKIVAGKFRL
jgi:hypothetical protein